MQVETQEYETRREKDARIAELEAENLKWQSEHTVLKIDYHNVEAARDNWKRLCLEAKPWVIEGGLRYDREGDIDIADMGRAWLAEVEEAGASGVAGND